VDSPRISAIVPVRNCEAYLGEAIASVLAQTVPVAEVLVVDDGSTDRSGYVADAVGSPVTVLHRRPGGSAPAARNLGVDHATGDLLAFLDADDTWAPDRLERQLPELERAELVFGHVEEFRSPELPPARSRRLPEPRGTVPGRVITTLLVRRESFELVGRFDENLPAADFIDWLARARVAGLSELMLPSVVARRRLHTGNTDWGSRQTDLLRALRASVGRGHQ